MKDLPKEAFCANCEWTGEATGITSCPVCGTTLSSLDSLDEEELRASRKEQYSADLLSKFQDESETYTE